MRKKLLTTTKNNKGVTLIEVIIGTVVISIIAAAAASMFIVASKSYISTYENTNMTVNQEAALNGILNELKKAKKSSDYPITITGNQITFSKIVDGSGQTINTRIYLDTTNKAIIIQENTGGGYVTKQTLATRWVSSISYSVAGQFCTVTLTLQNPDNGYQQTITSQVYIINWE